jgi:16S rRNA (cytosine1402-N4)-methyltransferase
MVLDMVTPNLGEGSPHQPVLYKEIINAISPVSSGHYIDGTVGAGGHAFGILDSSKPDGILLGLDIDPQAVKLAEKRLSIFGERAILVQASYTTLDQQASEIGWNQVQGILLDLGASSMQFDTADRGFSFQVDGPLDMRFNPQNSTKASDLVNDLSEAELADLIWRYGDEPHARKIARAIIHSRPLTTTLQLAEIIAKAFGGYRGKLNPATLTFQALRISVNQELKSLETVLPKALSFLAPGGRLAIISFHALEDRMVKQFFHRESVDCICPPERPVCDCGHKASIRLITRHPIRPTEEEIEVNIRARSARLRVAEKIEMA